MTENITERKRIEEALRESEERFRRIFDQSPIGVAIVSLDNRFRQVNSEFCRIVGYSEQELLSLEFSDITHPDDLEKDIQSVKDLFAGKINHYQTDKRYIRKDGKVVWARLSLRLLRDAEGRPIHYLPMIEDITERKEAEEALQRSESSLAEAQSLAHIGSYELDPSDGKVTWTDEMFRIAGMSPSLEVPAMEEYMQMVYPEDRDIIKRSMDRCIKENVRVEIDYRIVLPDGRVKYIFGVGQPVTDKTGNVVKIIGTVMDITERKRGQILSDALNSVNAALISTLDFDEIMRKVVMETGESMGCRAASIIIREAGAWILRYGFKIAPELIGARFSDAELPYAEIAVRNRGTTAISDIFKSEIPVPSVARKYNIRSALLVPLIVKDEVIGILTFTYEYPVDFTQQEIDYANKLGISISLALENARLFKAQQEAVERESSARTAAQNQSTLLQRALLPTKPSVGPGYVVADKYVPAHRGEEIGGDFYDIFPTEDGRVGILIGDVSGKGIEAASLAASTRSTVRAFTYDTASTGHALTHSNAVLASQQFGFSSFVTVFLIILDPKNGHICYSSAGHPPPIIRRANGEVEMLEYGYPPIGIMCGEEYGESESRLNPGDKIVLYTDGISEARRDSELFEVEGIERVLRQYGDLPPDELAETLFNEACDWANGHLSDDAAIIVIKCITGCIE